MADDRNEDLAGYISVIIQTLLVTGRQGAPAEGRLPFNPLHFHMLRILGAGQGTRPSDIAADLAVPRTTVSAAVKALEKRGLVETSPDPTDGRAIAITLTEQGAEVLAAIHRQDKRNAAAMLDALPASQRAAFLRAMERIAQQLGQTPEK